MSLFETGFAVDSSQPTEDSSSNGRKRKRPANGENGSSSEQKVNQVAEGEVNLEKLMKKLEQAERAGSTSAQKDGKGAERREKKARVEKPAAARSNGAQQKQQQQPNAKATGSNMTAQKIKKTPEQPTKTTKKQRKEEALKNPYIPDEAALAKREERKQKKANRVERPLTTNNDGDVSMDVSEPVAAPSSAPPKEVSSKSSAMTDLQKSMQKKLGGARFRWINEQLYTTSGERALELMREDPSMFEEYHSGFRSQASSWPSQPISIFLSSFLSSTSTTKPIIADLGCGDAQIAQTLVPKGFTVFSFDLVEKLPWIVEAQCSKRLPLPGSADESADGALVDVVVCCLSLMGNDWLGIVREARRVMKIGGKLKIAEVSSRFTDVAAFTELVASIGFKLVTKDDSNTHFILFDYTKVTKKPVATQSEEDLSARSMELLKPCVYKKR